MARKFADSAGVVVIGLGRFAKSLADELEREGVHVLAIDNDPKRVQELAGRWSHIVQADSTDVRAMEQLGIGEFSKAVIGMGNNLEASVLTAFVLRKLGVRTSGPRRSRPRSPRSCRRSGSPTSSAPNTRWASGWPTSSAAGCGTTSSSTTDTRSHAPSHHRASSGARSPMQRCADRFGVTVIGIKSPGRDVSHPTPTRWSTRATSSSSPGSGATSSGSLTSSSTAPPGQSWWRSPVSDPRRIGHLAATSQHTQPESSPMAAPPTTSTGQCAPM